MKDRKIWLRAAILVLALAVRQIQRPGEADSRRYGLVQQSVERGRSDNGQHLVAFGFVGTDMAGLKSFVINHHVVRVQNGARFKPSGHCGRYSRCGQRDTAI
jgi:hypothetical protein